MDLKNYKNILIYGYGDSGKEVEKILIEEEKDYKIIDKKIRIDGGKYLISLNKKRLQSFQLIVVSPAISIYNKYLEMARKMGIEIISELEFGYHFLNSKTIVVAVTGTNGKTTTVSLIQDMLKAEGKKSMLLGNIGQPLSCVYKKNPEFVVCEVSSFQLEHIKEYRANINVLLNISHDHLERHKTFDNYVASKMNLFKNCKNTDWSIFNADDECVFSLSQRVNCNKLYISKEKQIEQGFFIYENAIWKNINNKKEKVLSLEEVCIPPIFFEDVLAMVATGYILKIQYETILQTIQKYKILPHRYQLVTKSNNVLYIDDSKATNIHAMENSIKNTEGEILLLLGGLNKGLSFSHFFANLPSNIKGIIIFGEGGKKIYNTAKKHNISNLFYEKNLHNAIQQIFKCNFHFSVVLFSPACASFDEFSGYAERGNFFQKQILEMVKSDEETSL